MKNNQSLIDSIDSIYEVDSDIHWYKTNEVLVPELQKITPDLDDVIDHIDYVVDLIGIDHVGIGADWDGVEILPKNIEHIGKLPALTELLLERGYSVKEIKKILGENFKRVYKEVLK